MALAMSSERELFFDSFLFSHPLPLRSVISLLGFLLLFCFVFGQTYLASLGRGFRPGRQKWCGWVFVAYFPRKMCVGCRGEGRGGWWWVWGVRRDWAMARGMGFLVCVLMDDGYTRNVALLLMIIMYMRSLLSWLGTWKIGLWRGPQGNGMGGKGSLISLSSYLLYFYCLYLAANYHFGSLPHFTPACLSLPWCVPWCVHFGITDGQRLVRGNGARSLG